MAADIETLIRQALARQNGFDPEVRQKIYQSSRNALAKMIARSGAIPPDVIESRNRSLENTISKIEHEFADEISPVPEAPAVEEEVAATPAPYTRPQTQPQNPPVIPTVDAAPVAPDNFVPADQAEFVQNQQIPDPTYQTSAAPTPQPRQPESPTQSASLDFPSGPSVTTEQDSFSNVGLDPAEEYAEPTPQYARPRRKPIRYLIWLMVLAIFAVIAWVAYMVTVEFLEGQPSRPTNGQASVSSSSTDSGTYITILEPGEPGALVTAGNGTAEILTDITQPVIRITSVRDPNARDKQADPLLLELAPGILKEIAGKKVTVEILAKSGDTSPATFAVVCNFGALGECGRKRFRIGLQPEAVIFSIQISADYKEGQRAFLAINTDVTSAAALSGKGAKIDIVYARIRINKEG